MSRHKPKRPCSTCGRTTQALDSICRVCTREAREHENALTGGNWLPDRRGILRYVWGDVA